MSGTFVYKAWDNPDRTVHLPVRDCARPDQTRAALEAMLDRPVRWQAAS